MGQPRWAAAWHDFDPSVGGQVLFDPSPSQVNITFLNVRNFGAPGAATFQYQFLQNGTVHILWQAMNPAGNEYFVGWTPGNASPFVTPRDLSTELTNGFTMCVTDYIGLDLSVTGRPLLNTTVTLTTTNIPAGTSVGLMLLGFTQADPPFYLGPLGMPGCFLHVLDGMPFAFVPASSSFPFPLTIPNDPTLGYLRVITQSVTYSPPFTPLGLIAGNGIALTLGIQ